MHITVRKRRELKMLRQVNPYMSKYKIPREILEHVEYILDKKTLGKKGYVAIILNPIKDDEVDVLDELNLNCNEIEIPDNNFFYIVIKEETSNEEEKEMVQLRYYLTRERWKNLCDLLYV